MKSIRHFIIAFFLLFAAATMHAQEKATAIKMYFSGWENKNWNTISKLLADEFTFTSPNNDDHISTLQFKNKCWGEAEHIRRFEFTRIVEQGEGAYVTYRCFTKSNKTFMNTEYFTFSNGKIKSIEVFFGTGQGFPTNEKK